MEQEKIAITPANPEPVKNKKTFTSIKKFAFGMAWGLFLVAIYWSYSLYYHSSIPLARGIIVSLLFSISCGLITLKAGYKGLDNFLENLHH